MIPLTNPFLDPCLHFELQNRGELSRFISKRDRENRVIDAVGRVIKIRIQAFNLSRSILREVFNDMLDQKCFLVAESLRYPSDMLIAAGKGMDVFNQFLALRLEAASVTKDISAHSMASILDDDFSIDPSPQAGAASVSRFSFVGTSKTFWKEQEVVRELLEFGRE